VAEKQHPVTASGGVLLLMYYIHTMSIFSRPFIPIIGLIVAFSVALQNWLNINIFLPLLHPGREMILLYLSVIGATMVAAYTYNKLLQANEFVSIALTVLVFLGVLVGSLVTNVLSFFAF
jgi:hypothetical protein